MQRKAMKQKQNMGGSLFILNMVFEEIDKISSFFDEIEIFGSHTSLR